MVDFKKALEKDKPLSQRTEPRQGSSIPLPPGCGEEMELGSEPISELAIGDSLTGKILTVKSVQTAEMKKPNNLITFLDEALGPVKFWSTGALNNLLDTLSVLDMDRITIQRIEDEDFKKGHGKNWRIFAHPPKKA